MEIEVKIPVNKTTAELLIWKLYGIYSHAEGSSMKYNFKVDEYFSRYAEKKERFENKEPLARLRQEDSTNLLTLPVQKLEGFVKTFIDSPNTLIDLENHELSSFFTLKYKDIVDGVEQNIEKETTIGDVSIFREFLFAEDFNLYFSKVKPCVSVIFSHTNIDISNFHGHYYVEVECVEDIPAYEAQKHIENSLEALGLDIMNKDSRSWLEIFDAITAEKEEEKVK